MIIKPAKPSFLLKNILYLTGALSILAVLLLIVDFLLRKEADVADTITTPSSLLKENLSLPEVLEHFNDHTIYLSVNDDASEKMNAETRQFLKSIDGDTLAAIGLRQSYVGIFKNGKIIKEAVQDSTQAWLEWQDKKVISAGNLSGSFSQLNLNSILYKAESRGLNLFVVNDLNKIVGIWAFDFYANEAPSGVANIWSTAAELEGIEIVIDERHYNTIKGKRDRAVKNEVLLSGDEDLVPAKLYFKGKEYKIQMRLKGDWTDHLAGDEWSFRVKLENEAALMGMNKFSLHRPKTRNYVGEWLYQQALADAGIINLQYHFVTLNLKVKGEIISEYKNLGLYALEEAFEKHLIERNQRREGIILKLDEGLMWEERAAFLDSKLSVPDLQFFEFPPYEQVNVIPFSQKRVIADNELYKQFLTGSALFREFINRDKLPSEVFDVELLAKYHAITNLLGADHAMAPHNYRVYYNPVTSKLEPIGFDGNAGVKKYSFVDYHNTRSDIEYQRAYVKAVEEVTSDQYIEKLINWPGFNEMVTLMQTHFPKYEWPENLLIHNQKTLQKRINPAHCLRVNFMGIEGHNFTVSIDNFSKHSVEIQHLVYKEDKSFTKRNNAEILQPGTRKTVTFRLDENYQNLFTNKGKKKAGFDFGDDILKISLTYNIVGSSQLKKEVILPWNPERGGLVKSDPFQQKPNAHEFEFLVFDKKKKTISCKAGHWQLEKSLTIPAGYTFVAGPGCRIELMSQFTSIFSFSPLRFVGTPANPVEIFSKTGYGAGVLVLNAQDTSVLKHCQFSGLSNPSTYGWSVTGAINFYQSDVLLNNCTFSENRCEDALNILKSYFEMKQCIFSTIRADAFDGDFVNGIIQGCMFGNIGNDAIDVSGSKLTIENVSIKKAGDKGISAGEDSHIMATDVSIMDSEIAVASKDQSTIELSNCILKNNKLCFTAFQKKPEFGSAHIVALNAKLYDCQVDHLIESGSSLKLNGRLMETSGEVKEKMYGVEFGKSSK